MDRKFTALFMAGMLFLPAAAVAQDATEGHRLAVKWCTACHAVEKVVQAPMRDTAPSFLSIARMPSTTATSLTAFLMTPHPSMPNFSLSRAEIRNVVAYILDLREERGLSRPTAHAVPLPPR